MTTIAFFSGTNFVAKTITLFTDSPISHSAIGIICNGKPCWLHAAAGGVQIVDRGWLGGLYAEYEIIPNIDNEIIIAEKKVGEPYSKLTLIGFAIMIIAKWFGIGINNPFYEKSAVVCSEFIVEMDTQHLIHEFDRLDPANITPADLFAICSKGTSFKRLT